MKIKSLACGFIAGVLTATSVTAFALTMGSGMVEAYLQDTNVSILLDGNYVDLPEDIHILNYNGRIYTPARLIAESLGAEVGWEEARRAVLITSPEKEVVEKVKTVEVKVPQYSALPIKRVKENLSINLTDYIKRKSEFVINFNYKNINNNMITVDVKNAYAEVKGEKYEYLTSTQDFIYRSLDYTSDEKAAYISFEPVPEDTKELKIVIPVKFSNSYRNTEYVFNFEYYITLDEVEF